MDGMRRLCGRLGPDIALVSTTDFFSPLVDDPADFGAIAAANACSDIFAMGGHVVLALSVAAFPERLPPEVVSSVLAAAADTVTRAGGTLAGGHTIRSEEPIFGLAVQGIVHPDRFWSKAGSRPGDRLVLSKPLGTGIALASGDDEARAAAIAGMRSLNREAAARLWALDEPPHAVTDVTGFGLAGHGWEMAERGGVDICFEGSSLPCIAGTRAAAEAGRRTGGEARNRVYLADRFDSSADAASEALALDPQTSGGLLAAVDPSDSGSLVADGWWEVGEVIEGVPRVVLT
ncbi:selenide, water dikinase SelD [Mycobacterium helveticum]|uniref:Selenide, water dikinase SelD n=2 Tax=Mycobacterium helveticum TaxID=2592811 RepID=A0A557WY20_9MYCO|nr:selenide, water dikinase SelD [Mycobacterium helveticum]TVS78159.1 selenide, water dikinase SelD [Mycobacterium helveticum]